MDEEELHNNSGDISSHMQEELALGVQVSQFNLSGKSSSDSESSESEKQHPSRQKVQSSGKGPVAEDDYTEFLTFNIGPSQPVCHDTGDMMSEIQPTSANSLNHLMDAPGYARDQKFAEDRQREVKRESTKNKKQKKRVKGSAQTTDTAQHDVVEKPSGEQSLKEDGLEAQYFQPKLSGFLANTYEEMMVEDKLPFLSTYSGPFPKLTQDLQEFGMMVGQGHPSPGRADSGLSGTKPGCSCAKTKCTKMYCSCFSYGEPCTSSCLCVDCRNTPAHREQLEKKMTEAQLKNKEGDICCNCRWSQCENSYCSCTKNGKSCGPSCKCYNCKNQFGTKKKEG